jgi:hypothetical protein
MWIEQVERGGLRQGSSRRKPWRKTNAFCAPMATIRPKLKKKPWANTGTSAEKVSLKFIGHELASFCP